MRDRAMGLAVAALVTLLAALLPAGSGAAGSEERRLYVAVPGIRDYVEHGGVGILVFDIDHGHRWLKRIPTWETGPGRPPEAVKGVCASAATGRIYVSTPTRLLCLS